MKRAPCVMRFPSWGLIVLTTLMMVWSAGGQTLPPQQTAILWDNLTTTDAIFYLGTSGTYKLHFTEFQDGIFPSYLVEFWDTSTGQMVAFESFWDTTPACQGARTVTLAGGIKYRMTIEYAVAIGDPPRPGKICQARIFYTCTPE
ncbi:hypothetical protein KKH27_04480 [bacterium]|nr:hypothetical protein [bacterium]MBU1984896.1 hypothetical protein [bacterium]